MGEVGKNWGLEFVLDQGEGGLVFHVSEANIFNKYEKQLTFCIYKIWARGVG